MYSVLEEASYPLPEHARDFIKAGTYNPQHAQSFFLWQVSDTKVQLHEIHSVKQLKQSQFACDLAPLSDNENTAITADCPFYIQPCIEFVEYQHNGQNMIAFYVIASNWTLYQFTMLHPQQFMELNRNVSVLSTLDNTQPFVIPLPMAATLPFNRNVCFKMIDLSNILLCCSNQLSVLNIDDPHAIPTSSAEERTFIIHRKPVQHSNKLALLSSFLPFGASSQSVAASQRSAQCSYVCMQHHRLKEYPSRSLVAGLDNHGNVELYVLSNNYQICDELRLNLFDHQHGDNGGGSAGTTDDGSSTLEIESARVLFYPYRQQQGIYWFTLIVLFDVGGAMAIQCQYKHAVDKLVTLTTFEVIHELSMHRSKCMDAAVLNGVIWCCLQSPTAAASASADYDIFFCKLRHFLSSKPIAAPSANWKFERMWKRAQYIQRILDSIEKEFDFDAFYQQFETVCCASLDTATSATTPAIIIADMDSATLSRNIEKYQQKLHEMILSFWLVRLVDDPTLELSAQILEHQLLDTIRRENLEARALQPHWTITTFDILTRVCDEERQHGSGSGSGVENETMKRIKFESKLQTLMMALVKRKHRPSRNKQKTFAEVRSRAYIERVWHEYHQFFVACLETSKGYKKFMGFGQVMHEAKVAVLKQHGFSIVRAMDFAEQIEIYFDRMHDESDELHDFRQPPIKLYKFVEYCQNRAHIKTAMYHWFVACTWFYNQNLAVFNSDKFNLDDKIIGNTLNEDFAQFMTESAHSVKQHSRKQIVDLYANLELRINEFIQGLIDAFMFCGDENAANAQQRNHAQQRHRNRLDMQSTAASEDKYLAGIWYETSLISCVESSFASMVAARYSLLRSIYVSFLFIFYHKREYDNRTKYDTESSECMQRLLQLLRRYFVLSYLSSSIYQTKQYLGLNTHSSASSSAAAGAVAFPSHKRQELLENLQSSFRSGLVLRHFLRYWYNKGVFAGSEHHGVSQSYFVSPLRYVCKLAYLFLSATRDHALIYDVVEFMFCERQFEALQKILCYTYTISPLFQYLLARCHVEMERSNRIHFATSASSNTTTSTQQQQHKKRTSSAASITKMDRYALRLFEECGKYLNKPLRTDKERYLLGLVLTDEYNLIHDDGCKIDVYHLASSEFVHFADEFVAKQNERGQLSGNSTVILSSEASEFDWVIQLAYFAHLIQIYKQLVPKPTIVVKVANNVIDFLNREVAKCQRDKVRSCSSTLEMKLEESDDDDDDEDDDQDLINPARENRDCRRYQNLDHLQHVDDKVCDKVMLLTGVGKKRAQILCTSFENHLELILLSIYKSNFILEVVTESLKMQHYDTAYRYLIQFNDLYCAKTAIQEYVATCCKQRRMQPILKQTWSESQVQFTEWTKHVLSFAKSNNIQLKPVNYQTLVEATIYKFALQFNIEDSFCFDLLYTFSMKHGDYKAAAKYMFEYVMRVEHSGNKSKTIQKLQYHCLCQVLSALDLLPQCESSKYLRLDFAMKRNVIFANENEKIATYQQIKKYYILMQSKYHLLSLDDENDDSGGAAAAAACTEEQIARFNVLETALQLFEHGWYSQSLLLLHVFNNQDGILLIFHKMVEVLLVGGSNESDSLSWSDLEQLLLDYDDLSTQYRYTLDVLQTILSFNTNSEKFVLPSFIHNRIQMLSEPEMNVFIPPLVDILCEYGKILPSIRILCFVLNATNVSIKNDCYNYQNHSFWKIGQSLFAYCNTLALKHQQQTLLKSLANWIARPCSS